jgi:hypothetical protein
MTGKQCNAEIAANAKFCGGVKAGWPVSVPQMVSIDGHNGHKENKQ